MQVQDNEFWETIEHKLVDEKLYRHLNYQELADVTEAFSRVGRGSDKLFDLIEGQVIKHRKGLTE